jgi:hypothetical protein
LNDKGLPAKVIVYGTSCVHELEMAQIASGAVPHIVRKLGTSGRYLVPA